MLFIFILSIAAVSANELDENQLDNNNENDEILSIDSTNDNMDNCTIIGNDLVKYYKNDTQYEVQVFDENHTKLNNTKVEFTVNGYTS